MKNSPEYYFVISNTPERWEILAIYPIPKSSLADIKENFCWMGGYVSYHQGTWNFGKLPTYKEISLMKKV